jgi:hypothetical protein
MYGNPNADRPFPALEATTPYIVRIGGRAWLSSLGLAAVMDKPHTALLAAIAGLDIGPRFRAEHFRSARTGKGVQARGLWISPQGFDLLSLTFPRDQGSYWRDVLREAFRIVGTAGAVEIPDPAQSAEATPPGRGPAWFRRLLGRAA